MWVALCPGVWAAGSYSLCRVTGESDLQTKEKRCVCVCTVGRGSPFPLLYLRPKILGYSQRARVPGSQTGPAHTWDRSLFFSAAQGLPC